MRAVVAHSIKSVRSVNTKFGPKYIAEIEIQGEPQKELWMSIKQGEKLADCFEQLQKHGGYSTHRAECHIVLDQGEKGERFAWCGMHTVGRSDLDFLDEKFGVTCVSPYIGRDKAEDVSSDADPALKDQ